MAAQDEQDGFKRKNQSYQDLVMQQDPLKKDPNTSKNAQLQKEEDSQDQEDQEVTQQNVKTISQAANESSIQDSEGKVQALQAIQASSQQQNAKNAKALGLLKVLEGVERFADDAEKQAEVAAIKQQITEIDQLASEQQGAESATAAFNASLNNAQAQEQQGNEQLQQDRQQAAQEIERAGRAQAFSNEARKGLAQAAGEAIKEEVNPVKKPLKDPTSKILNAGVPGLGLLYKILGKLS
jgi:hypothetical protein